MTRLIHRLFAGCGLRILRLRSRAVARRGKVAVPASRTAA
jgi:hypothetical protein